MTLQEKVVQDLRTADDKNIKQILRIVVGELQRQSRKELSDDEVVRVIRKLYKAEKELLDAGGKPTDPAFLAILNLYLPEEITEEKIMEWILVNIDFSTLKNKMQAIGIVTKHFGSTVEGNVVKEIILKNF